jgi:hypothetical protein
MKPPATTSTKLSQVNSTCKTSIILQYSLVSTSFATYRRFDDYDQSNRLYRTHVITVLHDKLSNGSNSPRCVASSPQGSTKRQTCGQTRISGVKLCLVDVARHRKVTEETTQTVLKYRSRSPSNSLLNKCRLLGKFVEQMKMGMWKFASPARMRRSDIGNQPPTLVQIFRSQFRF